MNINCFCHHLEVCIQLVTMTYTAQWVHPTSLYWAVGKGTLCAVVPWGEALPWDEDLEDTPADLFGFYAVDDGIQHGETSRLMLAMMVWTREEACLPYQWTMDKPSMGMCRIRTAKIWDRQLFKALRHSFWDVMLTTLLQVIIYDKTVSNGSNTTMKMTTANPYMLLNVMSAHSSLISSWCRK